MDCEGVRENIDAWALGALDADDARQLERHLAGCAECPTLAAAAQEAASAVALAVPLRSASSSLKARLLAGAAVLGDERPHRARRLRYWPTAAAAGIAIVAGLVMWAAYMQTEVNDLRDENARVSAGATEQSEKFATASTQLVQMSASRREDLLATDAITEIVSQDDVARLTMEGTAAAPSASGRYVWSRTAQMGALVARGLPPAPEGTRYCMWLVYENDWVVGGQFDVDDDGNGRVVVQDLEIDAAETGRLKGFAVSVEPAGKVTKHTGETVLNASLE
ncbi:MAG: anti-sigma factor [Chloroflexi bacterium]|nr:anti-sigma factor [Chloroflexota bacterium]